MKNINIYLSFNGDCEEAFNFYRSVFGGEFAVLKRFKDMPAGGLDDSFQIADADAEKIMHVQLPLGKNSALMGNDMPASMGRAESGGNFSIALETENMAETDKLFNGLAAGGKIAMPLSKTFWSPYFGMLSDKFGIGWMLDCSSEKPKNH
ncbi:MAG: VOC family protein [Gammaproteobacteria bacterium]